MNESDRYEDMRSEVSAAESALERWGREFREERGGETKVFFSAVNDGRGYGVISAEVREFSSNGTGPKRETYLVEPGGKVLLVGDSSRNGGTGYYARFEGESGKLEGLFAYASDGQSRPVSPEEITGGGGQLRAFEIHDGELKEIPLGQKN